MNRLSPIVLALILPTLAGAAVIVPNTMGDTIDPSDGFCSLREAVIAANTNTASGTVEGECAAGTDGIDTIELGDGVYLLSISDYIEDGGEPDASVGDLDILADLALKGAGKNRTIIDASGICTEECYSYGDRIIDVIGTDELVVSISELTLTGGITAYSSWCGGGNLRNAGANLTLTDTSIMNGSVDQCGGGGGISNYLGSVVLNNTEVIGNAADHSGGIFNSGSMSLVGSTVMGNVGWGYGPGGIGNTGTISIKNSTLSGNYAETEGGGFLNWGGIAVFTNTTITRNRASGVTGGGGGIENEGGAMTLLNTTVTDNYGGGIESWGMGTTLHLGNSILAGNHDYDCSGLFDSMGHNLLTTSDCGSGPGDVFVAPEDVFGVVLGPLQDNGGPTETHALLPGSPAIDAASPDGCRGPDGELLLTDQRGVIRHLDTRCDIGAYEFLPSASVGIQAVRELISSLDVPQGIRVSLDKAAVRDLEGFIRRVEAQKGKMIPTEEADALIATAEAVLELLSD